MSVHGSRLNRSTQHFILKKRWSERRFPDAVLRMLVTPHPLGGCGMAASPSAGVVDHAGRVFNHPGLYVFDGSIVPRAIGLNPSKTIAALAERGVELLQNE